MISQVFYPVLLFSSYLFLLLLVYSFLGWCGEMAYCSLCQGRLCEKRGFLNGPLCPVYGHGALLVLFAMGGHSDSMLFTFLWGALLTSAVEYITSYIMEKLFHMRWWDYSHKRFNLNGRVCLLNSTLFGLACVLLRHAVHPRAGLWIYQMVFDGPGVPLAILFAIVYLTDIVLSVRSAIQIGSRLEKLHAIHDELTEKLAELKREEQQILETQKERLEEFLSAARQSAEEKNGEAVRAIQSRLDRLKEEQRHTQDAHRTRLESVKAEAQQRLKELCGKQDFFERRMLRSFPSMRSMRHGEALNKMREYLEGRRG